MAIIPAWVHPAGWCILHCGSGLAARPYYLSSPEGELVYGVDGRGWETLVRAWCALEALLLGEGSYSPDGPEAYRVHFPDVA